MDSISFGNAGGETFHYGTGGRGRGSVPYGSYPINIGKGDIGTTGQGSDQSPLSEGWAAS